MKKIAIIILALISMPSLLEAQSAHDTRYIGYTYKGVVPNLTLPNGVKHLGGGLIGDIEADPVYGISQVELGKTKMLWLEASTGKDASGVTGWKVLDVLSFPSLGKADYLFFAGDPGINCKRGGSDIQNLVGTGRILRSQGIFRPSKLWVANLSTKKVEPLAIAGVKCEYSEP